MGKCQGILSTDKLPPPDERINGLTSKNIKENCKRIDETVKRKEENGNRKEPTNPTCQPLKRASQTC